MSRHEGAGTGLPPLLQQGDGPQWLTPPAGYHSVAGKPAEALTNARKPPSLLDFIDDRVRGLDAERLMLVELRERVQAAGMAAVSVEDMRRLLG